VCASQASRTFLCSTAHIRQDISAASLLSLKIIAILTFKELPCVDNLQTACYANCRHKPGYCYQRIAYLVIVTVPWGIFCDGERVKRFVNAHLHCIVSNLKIISKMSTLPLLGKISVDARVQDHRKNFYRITLVCHKFNLFLSALQHQS